MMGRTVPGASAVPGLRPARRPPGSSLFYAGDVIGVTRQTRRLPVRFSTRRPPDVTEINSTFTSVDPADISAPKEPNRSVASSR